MYPGVSHLYACSVSSQARPFITGRHQFRNIRYGGRDVAGGEESNCSNKLIQLNLLINNSGEREDLRLASVSNGRKRLLWHSWAALAMVLSKSSLLLRRRIASNPSGGTLNQNWEISFGNFVGVKQDQFCEGRLKQFAFMKFDNTLKHFISNFMNHNNMKEYFEN